MLSLQLHASEELESDSDNEDDESRSSMTGTRRLQDPTMMPIQYVASNIRIKVTGRRFDVKLDARYKLYLHWYYSLEMKEYKSCWDSFINIYSTTCQPGLRPSRNRNGEVTWTENNLLAALTAWSSANDYVVEGIDPDFVFRVSQGPSLYAREYRKINVNGLVIPRATTTKARESTFLALNPKVDDNSGLYINNTFEDKQLWFGVVKRILEHDPPGSVAGQRLPAHYIVECDWYNGCDMPEGLDNRTGWPCLRYNDDDDWYISPAGPLWNAKRIAPVAVAVVDHPTRRATKVVLARDKYFYDRR
jgi:hypothetical protein